MNSKPCQLGLAALLLAAVPIVASAQTRLTVEATEFVLAMPDGRLLRSADLVGATLKISAQGKPLEVTIQSVEEDPYAIGGRGILPPLLLQTQGGEQTHPCAADAPGRKHGFSVPHGHRGGGHT